MICHCLIFSKKFLTDHKHGRKVKIRKQWLRQRVPGPAVHQAAEPQRGRHPLHRPRHHHPRGAQHLRQGAAWEEHRDRGGQSVVWLAVLESSSEARGMITAETVLALECIKKRLPPEPQVSVSGIGWCNQSDSSMGNTKDVIRTASTSVSSIVSKDVGEEVSFYLILYISFPTVPTW